MKRYAWGLCLIAALAMTGCEEKKEEIPIGTNSSSLLEDEEPADELDEEFPGEDIPDYQVELPEEMSSFTIAIWGEVYKMPVSYEDFISLGSVSYTHLNFKNLHISMMQITFSGMEYEAFLEDAKRLTEREDQLATQALTTEKNIDIPYTPDSEPESESGLERESGRPRERIETGTSKRSGYRI